MVLQFKLDEVKINVSQVSFQLEEANTDIKNTSKVIKERATMQTQAENVQAH